MQNDLSPGVPAKSLPAIILDYHAAVYYVNISFELRKGEIMKRLVVVLTLSLVLGMVSTTLADLVLTHKTITETMGMGGMEITVTQKIKGDMDFTAVTMNGTGLMATAAQGGDNTIISRIDKGVMWLLNPASKTYSEYAFADIKAMSDAGKAQAAGDSTADQDYTWAVNIEKLGESKINGFTCTGMRGTAEGLSVKTPGEKVKITYEVWVGRDLPGNDELVKHYKQMSGLTGQNPYSESEMVKQIFSKGGKQFDKLTKAAEEMDGFPVRLLINVGTTVNMDKELAEEAGADSETVAMMQQMKALLKSKTGEDGLTSVVSVNSDLTGIEVSPVDAAVFEIPAGYTKGF